MKSLQLSIWENGGLNHRDKMCREKKGEELQKVKSDKIHLMACDGKSRKRNKWKMSLRF